MITSHQTDTLVTATQLPGAAGTMETAPSRRRRKINIRGSAACETQTRTVVVTLQAARLEADDAIHLVVGDPASPSMRFCAIFPGGTPAAEGDGPLAERMRRARQTFIETIGPPPFEGFMLLYGAARLMVVSGATDGAQAGQISPDQRVLGSVVDFVALDDIPPSPSTSA